MICKEVSQTLDDIQDHLYQKALDFKKENTHEINSKEEFDDISQRKINKAGFAKFSGQGMLNLKMRFLKNMHWHRCIPLMEK